MKGGESVPRWRADFLARVEAQRNRYDCLHE